jgi:hypothetical protein
VAEWWPALAVVVVALLGLVVLALAVRRPVRRFVRARTRLTEDMRTGVAQLRALAYVRRDRHPHGVDSP